MSSFDNNGRGQKSPPLPEIDRPRHNTNSPVFLCLSYPWMCSEQLNGWPPIFWLGRYPCKVSLACCVNVIFRLIYSSTHMPPVVSKISKEKLVKSHIFFSPNLILCAQQRGFMRCMLARQ